MEFQSDRLYGSDKVTPINAADADDEMANNKKLIDIGTLLSQTYMYTNIHTYINTYIFISF